MKNLTRPFESLKRKTVTLISVGWIAALILIWIISASIGTTHLFPTPGRVFEGFSQLFASGLIVNIFSSLSLCFMAVSGAIVLSLLFAYSAPIPLLKPISSFVSKMRYLPFVGLSFYVGIMITGARNIQIWMLIIFMTTFLVTSLLAMIKDIPEQELDHARTLGCSRWEVLLEVVIKGRVDYVFEVVRQNLAVVWMTLVTVESILPSGGGLGFEIQNASKMGSHGKIIALYIIILLIGLVLDSLLTYLRTVIFRYSKI